MRARWFRQVSRRPGLDACQGKVTEMANPIRVGIIGLNANSGQAGRSHVPAIQNVPELVLQGVANRTLANSQEAAQKFGVPSVFDDVDALVNSPDIDLVVISTPVPSIMASLCGDRFAIRSMPSVMFMGGRLR